MSSKQIKITAKQRKQFIKDQLAAKKFAKCGFGNDCFSVILSTFSFDEINVYNELRFVCKSWFNIFEKRTLKDVRIIFNNGDCVEATTMLSNLAFVYDLELNIKDIYTSLNPFGCERPNTGIWVNCVFCQKAHNIFRDTKVIDSSWYCPLCNGCEIMTKIPSDFYILECA